MKCVLFFLFFLLLLLNTISVAQNVKVDISVSDSVGETTITYTSRNVNSSISEGAVNVGNDCQIPINNTSNVSSSSSSSSSSAGAAAISSIYSSSLLQSSSIRSSSSTVPGLNLCLSYNVTTVTPFSLLNTPMTYSATIYVDCQNGNDANIGLSLSTPFLTIEQAKLTIRQYYQTYGYNSNFLVSIAGPCYQQHLHFDANDSPSNGNLAHYTSTDPSQPTLISAGALMSSNWTLFNTTLNIYQLYVGSNWQASRGLFVNNVRMNKARTPLIPPSNVALGNFPINLHVDCTNCFIPPIPVGVTVNMEMSMLANWQSWRCQANVSSTHFLSVSGPCASVVKSDVGDPNLAWLENSLLFLNQPGTWVSNIAGGYIYAIPPVGTNLNTANVVLAVGNTLINITGASNLVFSNLVFAHTDYSDIQSPTGFTIYQGDVLFTQNFLNDEGVNLPYVLNHLATDSIPYFIPVAVYCIMCTNVAIISSTFQHISNSALRIWDSSQNVLIWNNTFSDISGSGIQIGNAFMSANTVNGTIIQGNSFINIAVELYSCMGIFQLYAMGSTIDHNLFLNTSYSAMEIGLSQDDVVIPNNGNNRITNNYMKNLMLYTQDGGGIYTNGWNPNTLIDGNYCQNLGSGYFNEGYDGYQGSNCLYFDYSTNGIIATQNNVADNVLSFVEDNTDLAVNSYPLPNNPTGFVNIRDINQSITKQYAGPIGLTTCTYNSPYINTSAISLFAFGGAFGQTGTNTYFNNPATGAAGCPTSYNKVAIYGTTDQSWSIFLCYYIFNIYSVGVSVQGGYYYVDGVNSNIAAYTYGGQYGNAVNNPYTGAQSCLSGYTAQQFAGTSGFNYNMYMCARPYQLNDPLWNFGGFYSLSYPNLLSYGLFCPSLYTSYPSFLNTLGYTQNNISFCVVPYNPISTSSSSSSTGVISSSSSSTGVISSNSSSTGVTSSSSSSRRVTIISSSINSGISSSSIATYLAYGGSFGGGDGYNYPNVLTGDMTCPSTYSPSQFFGQVNLNFNAVICIKTITSLQSPDFTFGGFYGNNYTNIYTGSMSCPSGFLSSQVLGSIGYDAYIYSCVRPYNLSLDAGNSVFGGVYSIGHQTNYSNPSNNAMNCPTGFNVYQASGNGSDYTFGIEVVRSNPYPSIFYCIKASSISMYSTTMALRYGGTFANFGSSNLNNSFTNQQNCPVGYTPQIIYGAVNVAYNLYVCYGWFSASTPPQYMINGIYGTGLNNPATSSESCPTGFTPSQFSEGNTNPVLYSCDRVYVNGDTIVPYNGFYSLYEQDSLYSPYLQINLLTLDLLCAVGTNTVTATSSPYPLYFCY